jgi:hypothetical protein
MSVAARVLAGSEALVHLDAAYEAAHRIDHHELVDLCERRVAALLTGRGDPGTWSDDGSWSDAERAALSFTEQYVVDVASMPDRLVADLRQHLGDAGLVDFVNALLVVEQRITLELVLGRLVPDPATGDGPVEEGSP